MSGVSGVMPSGLVIEQSDSKRLINLVCGKASGLCREGPAANGFGGGGPNPWAVHYPGLAQSFPKSFAPKKQNETYKKLK